MFFWESDRNSIIEYLNLFYYNPYWRIYNLSNYFINLYRLVNMNHSYKSNSGSVVRTGSHSMNTCPSPPAHGVLDSLCLKECLVTFVEMSWGKHQWVSLGDSFSSWLFLELSPSRRLSELEGRKENHGKNSWMQWIQKRESSQKIAHQECSFALSLCLISVSVSLFLCLSVSLSNLFSLPNPDL